MRREGKGQKECEGESRLSEEVQEAVVACWLPHDRVAVRQLSLRDPDWLAGRRPAPPFTLLTFTRDASQRSGKKKKT